MLMLRLLPTVAEQARYDAAAAAYDRATRGADWQAAEGALADMVVVVRALLERAHLDPNQ
jgi:hypothetical protein